MSKENRAPPSPAPVTGAGEVNSAPGPALRPAAPRPDAPRPDPTATVTPSWGQVIGTTARLWLERHVLQPLSRRNGSGTMQRKLTSVIIPGNVVLAAGAPTLALGD